MRRLGRLALLLVAAGCATTGFPGAPAGPGTACSARCDAMVCPQGSACTVDRNCNPRCEVERLPERLP